MLSRAFEWYRIVDPRPTSQTIDNRIAAARDIVTALDNASDWKLALGYATGVVSGFTRNFAQDSPVVQSLVRAIRAHESAFPQDLSENALALRACAAIGIGEILVRNGDKVPDPIAVFIASAVQSGLGVQPLPKGKHLQQLLNQLSDAAAKVLASGSLSRRRRLTLLAQRFEKLQEPTDLATAWKSLVPPFRAAMREVAQQSAIDREELNILWWMFAGVSNATGQPIAKMPDGAAILCCGAELGAQCLLPPTPNLEAMVRRAYENGRKPHGLTARNIESVVADWDGETPKVLVPDDEARALARDYPSLLPLSWLCDRLLASNKAKGWPAEFELRTGIPSQHTCSAASWAAQAFRERVAQRAYTESLGA